MKIYEGKSVNLCDLSDISRSFLILGVVIRFIISEDYWLGAESSFLGLGILLSGLAGNTKDNWEKTKLLVYTGFVSLTIGAVLFFYNTFFR